MLVFLILFLLKEFFFMLDSFEEFLRMAFNDVKLMKSFLH